MKTSPAICLGLVHFPTINKHFVEVTTSVTNMDIHDISRSCRTFGVDRYYLVTPFKPQQELVQRILGHWKEDKSHEYNPDRSNALLVAQVIDSVELAMADMEHRFGHKPLVCITGANLKESDGTVQQMLHKARETQRPILLLFGTGNGLAPRLVAQADFKLAPIWGREELQAQSSPEAYNHLSVRSAVAIYLSQLASE